MFIDPAAQYVGVQSVGKRHRSHRYAGGQAGRNRISLEFTAVLSPTASAVSLIYKCVHVSTLILCGHDPPTQRVTAQGVFPGRIPSSRADSLFPTRLNGEKPINR